MITYAYEFIHTHIWCHMFHEFIYEFGCAKVPDALRPPQVKLDQDWILMDAATTRFLVRDRRHWMTTGFQVWWMIDLAWAADMNSMMTAFGRLGLGLRPGLPTWIWWQLDFDGLQRWPGPRWKRWAADPRSGWKKKEWWCQKLPQN